MERIDPKILTELRLALADLYPDVGSIRRIVHDAGLPSGRIEFNSKSTNIWHAVLQEAEKSAKVSDLLAIVLREYPENRLQIAYMQYLKFNGQSQNLPTPPVNQIKKQPSLLQRLRQWLTLLMDHRNRLYSLSDDSSDLHTLRDCTNIDNIKQVHHKLSKHALAKFSILDRTMLRDFERISKAVDTALHQRTPAGQRLALSEIDDRLDKLVRELFTNQGKYHTYFYLIAEKWKQIVSNYLQELAAVAATNSEIDNPYIINLPLTLEQEIFVGRVDVASRIEQLLLNRRRPPLLVYGQRRMGKTSLLKNLSRLLPNTIIPLYVDLQGPATKADNYAGFLYNIARGIVDSAYEQRRLSLPPLTREALQSDPFTYFDEWLDEVEQWLGLKDTALLMLDEFEALDSAINRGRYHEEDVLGMLRHMIQHRPRFRILLAGSHTLEEYQRWSSYLINVEAVHLSYLTRDEAIQLIESPTPEFPLRYEPAARERVLQLTRCHPFLIQLICSEIVELKNEQDINERLVAQVSDVEAAIPEALQSGSFYFEDIKRNQVDECGRTILRHLAAQGEGGAVSPQAVQTVCPGDLEKTLCLLKQRELIELIDDGYRFQVELIRRWFV